MAHAIEAMVSGNRVVPWHRLGNVVEGALTAEEALDLGGLDWEVEKRLMYFQNGDQGMVPAGSNYVLVRTDRMENNVLGTCKDFYVPLQNREAFSFFDSIVSRKEAIYETAGVLYEGRRVWILAKMPGEIRVNGNDISRKYVLLTNGHDGTSSVIIKLVCERVVCANTLAIAMGEAGETLKIRHRQNMLTRLHDASQVMGFANTMYGELQEAFQALAKRKVTTEDSDAFFDELVGSVPKRLEKVKELYETGAGAEMTRGTAWGAYNAITEYVDHFAKYRSDNTKLNGLWFGDAGDLKIRALERALELV